MTDKEMADWHYAHRYELDAAVDEDEIIAGTYAANLSVTMSFRLPSKEAEAIRRAAADTGLSLSEWIRTVCSAGVAGQAARPRNRALEDAISSLDRDVQRLRDAAQTA